MKMRFLLVFFVLHSVVNAALVKDPVLDGAKPGRTYLKWVLDFNRDGVADVLVSEKPTQEEIEAEKSVAGYLYAPGQHAFAVYLGRSSDRNYLRDGGVIVDVERCYVGYIREVKRHGIVSVEKLQVASPSSRLGATILRVYCYVIEKDHTRRINLTPEYGLNERNRVFDKYLTESKRTKVQLQEVTPRNSN